MKVLTKGAWTKELFCKDCNSILEINKDDVQEADFGCGWGGDSEMGFYVKCEVCKQNIRMADKDVPAHVQQLATTKRRSTQYRPEKQS